MDAQISAALIGLGLIVITAVGAIVKALTDRVLHYLAENTQITREAKDAANGRLRDALDRLAAERDRVLALRLVVRERDDRLAYLAARLPEVERVLQGYQEKRQQRHTEREELEALQRALDEPVE